MPKSFQALLLILTFVNTSVLAEGTKEIMPDSAASGKLCLYNNGINHHFPPFALYENTDPNHRLYIHIRDINERVFLGFNIHTEGKTVNFRIKNPDGEIVFQEHTIDNDTTSHGIIDNYEQAINGPWQLNNKGYKALVFQPSQTGDHYIEFQYTGNSYLEFKYFDITVADLNNEIQMGRLWSKSWLFSVGSSLGPGNPNAYENTFDGHIYAYSKDRVVTKIDFNGITPYIFNVTCNENGCIPDAPFEVSRKSQHGFASYPQYKLFLNDPDSIAFPSGEFGQITKPVSISGCFANDFSINFSVNTNGRVDLILDLNDIPGFQDSTEDIRFLNIEVAEGNNSITWNGKDGLGNFINKGARVNVILQYYNGLTNLPLYDIERCTNGIKVEIIRPDANNKIPVFKWDDTNISNGSSNLSGCIDTAGCHSWDCFSPNCDDPFHKSIGDTNTINTWWYASTLQIDSTEVEFLYFSIDSIHKENISCHGLQDGSIEVFTSEGMLPLSFSINENSYSHNNIWSELPAGNYKIIAKDRLNCLDSISVVIFEKDSLEYSINQISKDTCSGNTGIVEVEISNGVSPYNYYWYHKPDKDTALMNQLSADTIYAAEISDSAGACEFIKVNIERLEYKFKDSVFSLPDTCLGQVGYAKVIPDTLSGKHPFTFHWSSSPAFADTISLKAEANYLYDNFYYVKVFDANHCMIKDSIQVEKYLDSIFIDSLKTNSDTCGYGIGSAIIFPSGGSPPYFANWSTVPPQDSTLTATGLSDTTYTVTVYDKNGCSLTTNQKIENIFPPVQFEKITLSDTCQNKLGFIKIQPDSAAPPYRYYWSIQPEDTLTNFRASLNEGIYSCLVKDFNGCENQTMIELINFEPAIIDTIFTQNDTCNSASGKAELILDSLTHGYEIHWNTQPLANSPHIEGLHQGLYQVEVTDHYGCYAMQSFQINNVSYDIRFDENHSKDTCNAGVGSYELIFKNGQAPYQVLWYDTLNEIPFSSNNPVKGLRAGNKYKAIFKDKYGCAGDTIISISNYNQIIKFESVQQPDRCNSNTGNTLIIPENGTPPYKIWINGNPPDDSSFTFSHLSTGSYDILIIDKNYCAGGGYIEISNECEIHVPNVLTPNADGFNDRLVIEGLEYFKDIHFTLFDRNGMEVIQYEKYSNDIPWTGLNKNGKPVDSGTYFYNIQTSQGFQQNGTISVIR